MLATLHAIERSCTRVPGSIKQIVLIDPDDLEQTPPYYQVPNVAAISFKSGKSAWAFRHDRFRGRLEDTTNTDNEAGDYFEYTLTATVRNIRLDVEWLRAKLINRRIHLVATYADGTQRFLPFVRLSAAGDSGESQAARNQYTFRAVCRLDRPAPLIHATITGTPGEGGDPTVPESTVTPVTINTTAAAYTYQVPAGLLLSAIWIRSNQAQTVRIGTTNGGEQLGMNYLGANEPGLFGSNMLRPTAPTNIYFTGLQGDNTIEIWLLG